MPHRSKPKSATGIALPPAALPSHPDELHAFFRNYFCDKDAQYDSATGGLSLAWSRDIERYVDPSLPKGLAAWSKSMTLSKMPLASRREGRVLSALYDTWTLYSWSQWISRHRPDSAVPITILHVDDHFDVAPPRLHVRGPGLFDAITGAPFDLYVPSTVVESIRSGAVGMGSFLTPFLHAFPLTEVRHLRQPPKTTQTVCYEINLRTEPDTVLAAGVPRPSVVLTKTRKKKGPGTYTITDSPDDWLANLGAGPVLLHIDMDYFNNRYDGDSDWKARTNRLDPDQDRVLNEVMRIHRYLERKCIIQRIADIAIAYSPGFFPAELWETSIRLARRLFARKPLSKACVVRAGHAASAAVEDSEVLLIRTRGGSNRGGGVGGESWRIEVRGKRAGVVFINYVSDARIGEHASVQVFLNAGSRGRHIGRSAFRKACLLSQYDLVYAHIRKSNAASIRAAMEAGFVDVTPSNAPQLLFAWRLPKRATASERGPRG